LSYLANTQTNKQTNKVWQKHNLLGGGNQHVLLYGCVHGQRRRGRLKKNCGLSTYDKTAQKKTTRCETLHNLLCTRHDRETLFTGKVQHHRYCHNGNKKFELMLTRCTKAYSSSGSVV